MEADVSISILDQMSVCGHSCGKGVCVQLYVHKCTNVKVYACMHIYVCIYMHMGLVSDSHLL